MRGGCAQAVVDVYTVPAVHEHRTKHYIYELDDDDKRCGRASSHGGATTIVVNDSPRRACWRLSVPGGGAVSRHDST